MPIDRPQPRRCYDIPAAKPEHAELDFPNKLTGWQLYSKMGKPKYALAPMVRGSDLPFRMLVRRYGCDLCYTPMYHARLFATVQASRDKMHHTNDDDKPLIVQFAGHDPAVMLQAAQHVEASCDAVDVNLGCPQGVAKRGCYGAYLSTDWPTVFDIVNTLHRRLSVPVTAKIRLPASDDDPTQPDLTRSVEFCKMLVRAGAQILAIHGRTAAMKGAGTPHWGVVSEVVKALGGTVPIIVNGGIGSRADADVVLKQTGAVGAMAGMPLMRAPASFCSEHEPSFRLNLRLATEYVDICRRLGEAGTVDEGELQRLARTHVMKMLLGGVTKDDRRRLATFVDLKALAETVRDVGEKVDAGGYPGPEAEAPVTDDKSDN